MQVLERRDVGEMYVGEVVCWLICMKLHVGKFTNIRFCLHQHSENSTLTYSFSPTYLTNIF